MAEQISKGTASEVDGLQLALVNNRFEGVVRAMMNTLLRTSRSAILNTARDFSCCVVTAGHELLAMAESIPVHVMRGPDLMSRTMVELHPDLRRGDAFLHNSPYHGNSHAADWSVLVPVIDDEGVHRFTVLAKAHLADCGNAVPTTYSADARDVYEEGALIFPCVRAQEDFQDIEDVIRQARLRIRVPDLWYGDYLAILAAARIGEQRVLELIDELGIDALDQYVDDWFDYSEARMAEAIEALPAGSVTRTGWHDPLDAAPDGIKITVKVDVDPENGRIEVDLRDNPECLPCGLNLTEATSATAAMIGIFSGIHADLLTNAGSFRRLNVLLAENCVVGIPRHPHSCSVATTNLAELTASLTASALAELGEGIGIAETGRNQPPATAVISGDDPRENGGPFVNQLMLAVTGGAAAPAADGWLTIFGIGAAGFLLRDSVEIDEMKYPMLVREQRILPDSEGAGRFRGAPGAYVEFEPVDCVLDTVYLSDGTFNAPRGVRGGGDGAPARQHTRGPDGTLSEELGTYRRLDLEPGETIISMSCGGGGYGPPAERDPARVARDVREGWVTEGRARDVYRVALDEQGDVDPDATEALRAESV